MGSIHIRPGGGALTDQFSTAVVPPGTNWTDYDTGLTYVFVYNAGASDIADNDVVGVFITTVARGHVSTTAATMLDYDDAGDIVSHVAGVAIGPIETLTFGWLWAAGFDPSGTITTDGTIAQGDGLVLDDGLKVATTEIETQDHGNFGFALAADVSTTLTGACLRNTAFLIP